MIHRFLVALALVGASIACGGLSSQPRAPAPAAEPSPTEPPAPPAPVEEKPGYRRVTVPDVSSPPMEAYTMLVPTDWKVEGGITWEYGGSCTYELMQNRITVSSADGAWVLDLFPGQAWQWARDAKLRRNQAKLEPEVRGCRITPLIDLAEWFRGPLAQEIGAEVISVEPHDVILRAMQQEVEATNAEARSMNSSWDVRPSAAVATLVYPDQSAGLALATMTLEGLQPISPDGTPNEYEPTMFTTARLSRKVVLRFPAGQESRGREVLDTIVASIQIEPAWKAAVQERLASGENDPYRGALQGRCREPDPYSAEWRGDDWDYCRKLQHRWSGTVNDPSGTGIEFGSGFIH